MRIEKDIIQGNHKLVLLFSGWAASPDAFKGIGKDKDTDLWICYDYREIMFDQEALAGYREIHLVAWSLGVWVASVVLRGSRLPILEAIAINGTPCPVHDQWGIPEVIFQGTLDNLTEEGLHRFNRRMCGNRKLLEAYEEIPSRPLTEVREELEHLFTAIQERPTDTSLFNGWTRAIISSGDRIFPTGNLHAYWQDRCPITEIEAPHYPFYVWKQWNELWRR